MSQFRHAGFLAVALRPRFVWSARGDSNPDLHGLNVLRLPVAPRAEVVTTGGFEPPTDRLSTCRLSQGWATWSVVPLGGFEPPPRGLRARNAALTPQRDWFGLRDSHASLHAGDVGCCFHTQAEHGPVLSTGHQCPSVFKDPALASRYAITAERRVTELGAAPEVNSCAAIKPGGSRPPNPRTRNARTFRIRNKTSPRPVPISSRVSGQNKKGLLGGHPRRPECQ